MKKKRLANIVMVLLIVVIAVTGLLTAFHLRGGEDGNLGACTKLRRFRTMLSSPRGRRGTSAPSPSSATPFWTIWGRWTRKKRPMFPKTR